MDMSKRTDDSRCTKQGCQRTPVDIGQIGCINWYENAGNECDQNGDA